MDILYTLREIKVHLHSPAKITLMLILHHIYLRMCAHGILCSGISNIGLCVGQCSITYGYFLQLTSSVLITCTSLNQMFHPSFTIKLRTSFIQYKILNVFSFIYVVGFIVPFVVCGIVFDLCICLNCFI